MSLEDIEILPEGSRLTLRLMMANGLHARPAARISKEAQRYRSSIRIISENGEADAKSILDVLSLAIPHNSLCTLEATGPDAREAVAAVGTIFLQQD